MDVNITQLIGVLFWLVLVVFVFVKGKVPWGASILTLCCAVQSIVVTLILFFVNPLSGKSVPISDRVHTLFLIPAVVGVILLVFALLAPMISKSKKSPPASSPSWMRWLGLVMSEIIVVVGLSLSLMAIFAAPVYGLNAPSPLIAVLAYSIAFIPACFILYLVSRMNGERTPNLMRWIALVMICSWYLSPLVISLILVFGFPGGASEQSLLSSALASLAYIPIALLLLGLAKDYVTISSTKESAITAS